MDFPEICGLWRSSGAKALKGPYIYVWGPILGDHMIPLHRLQGPYGSPSYVWPLKGSPDNGATIVPSKVISSFA